MKFYYNGKLMRTSKTHEYKFAIIWPDGTLSSCHGTREAAEKEYRRPISEAESSIATELKAIEAIKAGKTYLDTKVCGRWYRMSLKGKDWDGLNRADISTWEKWIECNKRNIEKLNTRLIVELEARA